MFSLLLGRLYWLIKLANLSLASNDMAKQDIFEKIDEELPWDKRSKDSLDKILRKAKKNKEIECYSFKVSDLPTEYPVKEGIKQVYIVINDTPRSKDFHTGVIYFSER